MTDNSRSELTRLLGPLLYPEIADEFDRAADDKSVELILNSYDRFRLGKISVGSIRSIRRILGASAALERRP